ncbi:hypothetical protein [Sneathiella marina]|uniref:hypothetical protein n=1 Tax=Sneathiella marina TaxID=2950108 RepID=UPI003B84A40D
MKPIQGPTFSFRTPCYRHSSLNTTPYSAEEETFIVLDGLRGEESIAELCRKEGLPQGIYYK